MRQLVIAILVSLMTVLSGPSFAADAAQTFSDGVELFNKGDYYNALPKFREALDMSGSPNARLYMGRCLGALGRITESYDEMTSAMREASEKASFDQKYVTTRDAAAAQLAIMEPKIGKLMISVIGADTYKVKIDGKDVPKDKIGTVIALLPKSIALTGEADERLPFEKQVEIRAGQTTAVTVELKKTEEAGGKVEPKAGDGDKGKTGPTPAPLPPVEPESEFGGMRIGGVIAGVIGIGGIVVMGVTGSMANSRKDTLETECGGTNCTQAKYQTTIDEGKTYQTVANIGLGVGIGGIALGALLIILGGPSNPEEAAAPAPAAEGPTAAFGTEGGVVGYKWRF